MERMSGIDANTLMLDMVLGVEDGAGWWPRMCGSLSKKYRRDDSRKQNIVIPDCKICSSDPLSNPWLML